MTTVRRDERLKVLILSTYDGAGANVVRDYLLSFRLHSRHEYFYVFDCSRLNGKLDLSAFDVVVIFWDVQLLGPDLADSVRKQIAESQALKVVFLQDEFGNIRRVNRAMADLGIQLAFTCAPEEHHGLFYPSEVIPTLEGTYTVLTGYVPRYLERIRLDVRSPRGIDFGYRSRTMPYYLGDLGQEKTVIAERFQALARAEGFASDISVLERDRLYGRQWLEFLRNCRCVLGTSSGTSVVDFTGEIQTACERYLAVNPEAAYREVKARFFADTDWKTVIDTISPRVFEATAMGCTLVHHEGLYSHILRPDEHYICVRRDYSNVAEVVDRIRDRDFCREMARRAHQDLIATGRYSFETFARWFDGVLDKHVARPRRIRSLSPARFYAEGYLRRRQAVIPYAGRLMVAPSMQFVGHLVRLALALLPRARRGPLMSRLIHNPAGIVRKGLVAWRMVRRDPALRGILAVYRQHSDSLPGVRLYAVLDDLLRLDVIRRARMGTLQTPQPFVVALDHDGEANALVVTSSPGTTDRGSHGGPETVVEAGEGLADALVTGSLRALVWDHAAVASHVVCRLASSGWLTFRLGQGGVYRFHTLEQVYRCAPATVGRAVAEILGVQPRSPSWSDTRAGAQRGEVPA